MKPIFTSISWTSRTRSSGYLKIHTQSWWRNSILQNALCGVQSASKGLLDWSFIDGIITNHRYLRKLSRWGYFDYSGSRAREYNSFTASWTPCIMCLAAVFCQIDFQSVSDVGGPGHHAHRTWIPVIIFLGAASKVVCTAPTRTLFSS